MKAIQLIGHGDADKLIIVDDAPKPVPGEDEVLIKVGACAINNTDIWTRQGAYGSSQGDEAPTSWQRNAFQFPRIQGVDIAGHIESVGSDIPDTRIGQRVLVNPCIYAEHSDRKIEILIGSERDGGFAEYCAVPSENAVHINSDYSDVELASFPCAYGTAESMLNKASISANDTLIITGASGGVGSALIQLAKLRGAKIISIAGPIVDLDMRTVYLNELKLIGATAFSHVHLTLALAESAPHVEFYKGAAKVPHSFDARRMLATRGDAPDPNHDMSHAQLAAFKPQAP